MSPEHIHQEESQNQNINTGNQTTTQKNQGFEDNRGASPVMEEESAGLDQLAQQMTVPGFIDSLRDAQAMNILKNVFDSNWFKAKDVLLMDQWDNVNPGHDKGLALMKRMITLRTNTWAAFVKKTVPGIVAAVEKMQQNTEFADLVNPAKLEENLRLGVPAGSDALTADIDIPLKGENTEIGLNILNVAFYNEFGVESGSLFDINLYSSDWMFGGNQIEGEAGEATYQPRVEFALDEAGTAKKDDQNEVWSMVKIRRNLTAEEWSSYKASILADIMEVDQHKDMEKKMALVEREYNKFDQSVQARLQEMFGATVDEMDHYAKDAAITTASNSIYEEKALVIKALRLEIKKLQASQEELAPGTIEARIHVLHNEIAKALTYANEVYATQGAVLHTVYGKQGAVKDAEAIQTGDKEVNLEMAGVSDKSEVTSVKYALTKEMYLQSANENVGDTLHAINHYADNGPYGGYRAGKYLDRMIEATIFLLGETEASKLPNYVMLKKIATNAVKEKKGDDGKINAGNDPKAVTKEGSYFRFMGPKDLQNIKKWTLAYGAAMTTAYKNSKKSEESV